MFRSKDVSKIYDVFLIVGEVFVFVGIAIIVYCIIPMDFKRIIEYVGGDAYNAIIAATMRSGFLSGGFTLIGSGTILMFLSTMKIAENKGKNYDDLPNL